MCVHVCTGIFVKIPEESPQELELPGRWVSDAHRARPSHDVGPWVPAGLQLLQA